MPPIVCLNLPHGRNLTDEPGTKSLVDKDDPLTELGRAAGARVYQSGSGSYYGRFRLGKLTHWVQFGSKEHAEEAFTFLAQQSRKAKDVAIHVDRAGVTKVVDAPEAPPTYGEIDPSLKLQRKMYGEVPALLGEPEMYVTGKISPELAEIMPARVPMRRLGKEGQLLVEVLDRARKLTEQVRGRGQAIIEKALEGVDEAEIKEGIFLHSRDGTPLSPAGQQAWNVLNQQADRLYESARFAGVPVAQKVERYFPYVYNVARLTDDNYLENAAEALVKRGGAASLDEAKTILENRAFGTSRGKAIQQIKASHEAKGRKITDTEAEHILNRFVKENNTFISGHLERERLGSLDPLHDARTAYTVMNYRNARRVAEAEVFGPHYEKAYQIIDTIREAHGPRAANVAKKLLDAELGRVDQQMPRFLEGVYEWQGAKLSLSVLANATQSTNTAMVTGIKNLMKGFGSVLKNDIGSLRQLQSHIREVGAFATNLETSLRDDGIRALLPPEELARLDRPLTKAKRGVLNLSLSLFNYVEAFNRAVATRAGEHYFVETMRLLDDPAKAALATRRLAEFGVNAKSIAGATADELTEMKYLMGSRVSDYTQFRSNPTTKPLWAQSPLGAVMYQFKQFALGQSEFITREIFGHHGDTMRRARAIAAVTAFMPALGFGMIRFRETLFGSSLASDQVDKALEDPTVKNVLAAGAVAMASVGAIGILADMATTAYLGNTFALQATAISPTVSTALNTLNIGASVARGVVNQDTHEFDKAFGLAGREFGGVGTGVVRGVRKAVTGDPDLQPKNKSWRSGLESWRAR